MPFLPVREEIPSGDPFDPRALEVTANLGDVVASFAPAARFRRVSFASYEPSPRYRSQAAAVDRLRRFADELNSGRPGAVGRLGALLGRTTRSERPGLYLDGGFGVGKTHLLAATYHAARVPRVYLSFSELAQTIVRMGLEASVGEFRRFRLICVDEFELDDVASTRMAAAFLRRVFAGGRARVVVTSNTLPSELGQGRFAAASFAREIGEIASAFEVLTIEGDDYRHRSVDVAADDPATLDSASLRSRYRSYQPRAGGTKALIRHDELLGHLASLHPIHYGRLAESLDAIFLDELGPIAEQDAALRFVHLVDKLYDRQVRLFVSTVNHLREIFPAEYRSGSYARKYGRCLSRIHELLAESAAGC